MVVNIFLILLALLGLGFLAKYQVETVVFRYKRVEICPKKNVLTAHQAFAIAQLAGKYTKRSAVCIPRLRLQVKLPVTSEVVGSLILFGTLLFSFYYSEIFPLIFSVAIGGASWILITKYVLIRLLNSCDTPSIKLVGMAVLAYPLLFAGMYLFLYLIDYFNIYNLPPYFFK